jgi:hypothetical protein
MYTETPVLCLSRELLLLAQSLERVDAALVLRVQFDGFLVRDSA